MAKEVTCDRCKLRLGTAEKIVVLDEKVSRHYDLAAEVMFPRALDVGRKLVETDFCAACLDDLETWFHSGPRRGQ